MHTAVRTKRSWLGGEELRKIQFNTVKRHMAHESYLNEVSGGVYSISPADKTKCEFDENGILKALNDR